MDTARAGFAATQGSTALMGDFGASDAAARGMRLRKPGAAT